MTKNYILPGPTLEALLRYLAARPYAEVAPAIDMLQRLEEAPAAAPAKKRASRAKPAEAPAAA